MPTEYHNVNVEDSRYQQCLNVEEVVCNLELSDKARLLLITFLCLPDTWEFTIRGAADYLDWAPRTVQLAVNELEDTGYYAKVKTRNTSGQFVWRRHFYESPDLNPFYAQPSKWERKIDTSTARLGAEETTICWRPERAYYYMSQASIEANPVCIFWVRPPEDPFTSYGVPRVSNYHRGNGSPRVNNYHVDENLPEADLVKTTSNNDKPGFTLSPLAADQPDRANRVKKLSPVLIDDISSASTHMIINSNDNQVRDDNQLARSTSTSVRFEAQCFPQRGVFCNNLRARRALKPRDIARRRVPARS